MEASPSSFVDYSRERKVRSVHDLWMENKRVFMALNRSTSVKAAREELNLLLESFARELDQFDKVIHPLEWDLMRTCQAVARRIISQRATKLAKFDVVEILYSLAHEPEGEAIDKISIGFLEEILHLFTGVRGQTNIYKGAKRPHYIAMEGREAAVEREKGLDRMAQQVNQEIKRYRTGLQPTVIRQRRKRRAAILKALDSTMDDWNDWTWQAGRVARGADELAMMANLSPEERLGIEEATRNHLPFGVTPYYASLMDDEDDGTHDHAIRAQVIPDLYYVDRMAQSKAERTMSHDFMLERDTSPIDLITRRYPMICILKPYNTCPQICVYCQRNWEIDECLAKDAMASEEKLNEAFEHIESHKGLTEVLVTGGDPFAMGDGRIERLVKRLAEIPHIQRIRFGTRSLVTMPMRVTPELVNILSRYHEPGHREICVVTHVEHVYEITPELVEAAQRLRRAGLSMYNQMVYTMDNARRFEAVATRRLLHMIGIEPYYTFVLKGKEETEMFRVPIARILQERKEEVRLMPGLDRADDAVFNVPRLGKNVITRLQDHQILAFLPDGRRLYEFLPWEKNLALADTYLYTDISIYEFLGRLKERGEDPKDYRTIYFYY